MSGNKFFEHKPLDRNHEKLYTGDVWYVAGDIATSGDGKCPACSFKTIGEAFTAVQDGDAIRIKAGTYTETGLDLSNNSIELYFEIGSIIDPATGTALVISGDYCSISGKLRIEPAAGQIGLQVTGVRGVFEGIQVHAGGTGYQLTGAGHFLRDCSSGSATTTAFDIQANSQKLYSCRTVGVGATKGYKISNSADNGVLCECISIGHTDAGYYIDTGSSSWVLEKCISGIGDGKWRDIDSANEMGIVYPNEIYKEMDIPGNTTVNLFKITGAVKIEYIWGHVTTATGANTTVCSLILYDGTNTVQLTSAGGQDLSDLPANSLVSKTAAAANALTKSDATSCWLSEPTGYIFAEFAVGELTGGGGTTYIKYKQTGVGTTGTIHWHCKWKPLTESAVVEPA